LPSPDGNKYPFVPAFGIKDTVYSGSKAVMKNYSRTPKKTPAYDQCFRLKLLVENNIFLFQNSNKRGSLGQFFQFGSAYIRAGAPDATKDIF
jgi:hypothetical protein